jgi:SAM-dependent methyltransferase
VRWRFDETAGAGPEHLDPAYVATFDRKSGTDWSEDVETLLANGIGESSTVVDLGAGTGSFADAIGSRVARVVSVDASPAMVAAIRSRGLEAVRAGFLTYEHDGEPVDAVFSRNALHHLPDFWKGVALARIHDLLAPGGVLVLRDLVYDFEAADAAGRIEEWLASAAPSSGAGWTREELEEHVRDEQSTFAWLLEPLLGRAGLEIVERDVRSGIYATYACRRT